MASRIAAFDNSGQLRRGYNRANRGLLLDKFMDPEKEAGEAALRLKSFEASHEKGEWNLYKMAFERWKSQWTGPGTVSLTGRVHGRFVTGLGSESVLEIGLRVHSTYGVPVIPASAIKGVLQQKVSREEYRKFLFGDDNESGFAGLQDAWWVPSASSPFHLDVLTVHHQAYYRGTAAPTDFDSPIPVQFLSVTGEFLFVIQSPNNEWTSFLEKLLVDVLTHDGIGAKRSSGYGRFTFSAG